MILLSTPHLPAHLRACPRAVFICTRRSDCRVTAPRGLRNLRGRVLGAVIVSGSRPKCLGWDLRNPRAPARLLRTQPLIHLTPTLPRKPLFCMYDGIMMAVQRARQHRLLLHGCNGVQDRPSEFMCCLPCRVPAHSLHALLSAVTPYAVTESPSGVPADPSSRRAVVRTPSDRLLVCLVSACCPMCRCAGRL